MLWNQTIFLWNIIHHQYPIFKFELNHARHFRDMNSHKFLQFFLSNNKNWYKLLWHTGRGCIGACWCKVWLGYNKHLQSYLQLFTKLTPICYNDHMINHSWEEAESQYGDRVTSNYLWLKIELKTMRLQWKTWQCLAIEIC